MNVTDEMVKRFQDKYREFWKGSWPDSETSRELLEAALSAAPQPVAVKALEWRLQSPNIQAAETIVGSFWIEKRTPLSGVPDWYWRASGERETCCRSEDAAKAAAQAGFERRILSALTTPLLPTKEEDLVAAREAAAQACEDCTVHAFFVERIRSGGEDYHIAIQSALIAIRAERARAGGGK